MAGKIPIPGGIEPKHLAEIRQIMEDNLTSLNDQFKVMQIDLRLNRSVTSERLPYFIDWVGVKETLSFLKRDEKDLDPGLFRFGDDTPSDVNKEAVDGAPSKIIDRDWKTKGLTEKRPGSKALAQKAQVTYQKFIGIIAFDSDPNVNSNRCIGTFTAGFKQKPNNNGVDKELERIAGWTKSTSDLVEWIQDNLILGGPLK